MARFKYKYADVDCSYCLHTKQCEYDLCPHIIDNLDDLRHDKAFGEAVQNVEACNNRHKQTLLHIKELWEGEL